MPEHRYCCAPIQVPQVQFHASAELRPMISSAGAPSIGSNISVVFYIWKSLWAPIPKPLKACIFY
jgi:hypothetical protein